MRAEAKPGLSTGQSAHPPRAGGEMKATVFSLEGKKVSELELPAQFSAEVDTVLIRRAVQATQTAGVQTHFPFPLAGRNNTAIYIGSRGKPTMHRTINVGHARKPRLKNRRGVLSGQVAGIPGVVGGPKAHPPKANKVWGEKINRKEKRKAIDAAIAATGKLELVKKRGHKFSDKVLMPIVVESRLEGIERTGAVLGVFSALGIDADVEKAKAKKRVRAGKGKKRGRVYKRAKSVLIVAENTDKVFRAARNIEGVDVVSAADLNADVLAPGGLPGRLTVWTENALKALGNEIKIQKAAGKNSGAKRERLAEASGEGKANKAPSGPANETSSKKNEGNKSVARFVAGERVVVRAVSRTTG